MENKNIKIMLNISLLLVNIVAFIYLSSGLLIIVQNILIGKTVITPAMMKSISAFLLLILLLLYAARTKLNKTTLFSIALFAFIITISFDSIVINSSPKVGLGNSLGAFFYNYSLLIFILPLYFLLLPKFYKHNIVSNLPFTLAKLNITIIVLSSILTVCQSFTNDPLIWSSIGNLNDLNKQGLIRLSRIGDVVRWSGIFRTPLEAGIVSIFVLLVLIELFFKKNSLFLMVLIFTVITGILLTGSRSVILMFIVSTAYILFIELIIKKNFLKKRIFIILTTATLLAIFFVSLYLVQSSYFSSVTDPTNLYIRLENWSHLVNNIAQNWKTTIFGLGIVQNGTYGSYHSVIIDNTYIGILLTGGVFGLIVWFILFFIFHVQTIKFFKKSRINTQVPVSFYFGFMFAALTENLMHLLFIVPLLLLLYATYKLPIRSSYVNG